MDKGILNGAFAERVWTKLALGYIDEVTWSNLRFGHLYISVGRVAGPVEYKTGSQVTRL